MRAGTWALWSTVAAIAVEGGMAVHFWRRRGRFRAGRWFVGAVTTAMLGAVCFLGQLLAPTAAGAVFWSQLVGIAGLGSLVTIFGFAATYTHREWVLRSRPFEALAAALAAVYVVRMTNALPGWPGVHQLWATDATTAVRGGVRLVDVTWGPVGLAYTAVIAVWLVVVSALLVEFTLRPSQRLYRRRNAAVTVGIATPALAAIAGQTVAAGFEVTVPGVALAMLLIGAALSRFGALEAVPIARTGVVDEIDGGVVVFDERERVVDVTTRAREVLAVEEADAADATLGADLPVVLADALDGFDPDADPVEQLDDATFELDRDGHRRYVETRVSTLTDRSGARLSRALLLYDVTDRVERRRELERKNEFLDEFASVVSHDIATPLGVVENKARLVEMTGDASHAEDIYAETERVRAIVEQLRKLARQGKEIGETGRIDVRTVARDAWESVRSPGARLVVAGGTGCTGSTTGTGEVEASDGTPERDAPRRTDAAEAVDIIEREAPPTEEAVESGPVVDADRKLLRQLLENLLRNSVEHGSTTDRERSSSEPASSDDGGEADIDTGKETNLDAVEVTVRVGALDDRTGFFVADDGPGIPPDDRERVFEQGYTTGDENTGLGLAIVRLVADAHDWSVAITDSAAGGARFEVRTGE